MRPAIQTLSTPLFLAVVGAAASAQTQAFVFEGDLADAYSSRAVSSAGDVNADGFDDVIVGTEEDDAAGSQAGSAAIFSGKDGALLHRFFGEAPNDFFGNSVDSAGDVDADGYGDVVVGARFKSVNGFASGSAYVFSGRTFSLVYRLDGDSAGDLFGFSVAGPGDIDADGYDDVLVGAWSDDDAASGAGSARVFSGRTGLQLQRQDGNAFNDNFGFSVSGAGDVNADGRPDYIVGSKSSDLAGSNSGSARVFSGLDGSQLYEFPGIGPNDSFGVAVDGAGDVNNDGYDDVIVGASESNFVGAGPGYVRVMSGSDGAVLHTIFGDNVLDSFGGAVAGLGDINNDGMSDFMAGAAQTGSFGAGYARVFSGLNGSIIQGMVGTATGDAFGFSLASAGDINRDGVTDFIVGAPFEDATLLSDVGMARVYLSQCIEPVNYCVTTPNATFPFGAYMRHSGAPSVAMNSFHVEVVDAEPNGFGILFYATNQVQLPFANGVRCVGGGNGILRYPPVAIDGRGEASTHVNFTRPPANTGPGMIVVGSTWNFQYWYRDPNGPGPASSNLSDGMQVTFCP